MENGTLYELGYLLNPILPEEKLAEEVTGFRTAITGLGGEVTAEGEPRMRYLAYTVVRKIANKNTRFNEAHNGWMRFRLMPDQLASFEETLKKNDNMVRHLLITIPRVTEAPVREEQGTEPVEGEVKDLDKQIDQLVAA